MITAQEETQVAKDTSDSAVRLYKYYIDRRGWKHFNPLDYKKIGEALGWTTRKTETHKAKLVSAGYLVIVKDTLNDGTKLYRLLLGKDIVSKYKKTGTFPELSGSIEDFDFGED